MTASEFVIAYIATVAVFLAIDAVWLSKVALNIYRKLLGDLLRQRPRMAIAAAFYAVYGVGVVYFAVWPAWQSADMTLALLNGALLGAMAYGTYDVTNLATIRDWPWQVTVMDWLWGTVLTAVSAIGGYLFLAILFEPASV